MNYKEELKSSKASLAINSKYIEMNRNIILVKNWLKQFGVCMYYDLGYIRIGKSYVKM